MDFDAIPYNDNFTYVSRDINTDNILINRTMDQTVIMFWDERENFQGRGNMKRLVNDVRYRFKPIVWIRMYEASRLL